MAPSASDATTLDKRIFISRSLHRKLLNNSPAVDPDVLAADLGVAKLPDVQHAERDAPAVSYDAHERARHGAGPLMLDGAEIAPVIAARHLHALGGEGGDEMIVEFLRGGPAEQRTVRGA